MHDDTGTAGDGAGAGARWSVGVLASGVENLERLDAGTAPSVGAAWAAATAAMMAALQVWGRREFWLSVAGAPVMMIPGLTVDGRVDVDDARAGLEELAARNVYP
ncbi:hypothetical protein PSU4_60390 [Pseudonocardia sulfidoxydans NBRC 16205]|uniref:Uncharacterized protein n=1 Tax=Pseudonocardia sulfidoxydans NBRC 16205 TaxID=1223511 RepID=A0A511DQI4_9PSEU|nr:hypothetical protein [Pseudonocardia sulfidoxydans]GEL27085.1 hypothetical protein PSU4_60390 [Pseudonocardia sulfidoxydans NBRC 16205]